jgi:hypothetical protein
VYQLVPQVRKIVIFEYYVHVTAILCYLMMAWNVYMLCTDDREFMFIVWVAMMMFVSLPAVILNIFWGVLGL